MRLSLLLVLFCGSALAGPTPPAVRAEIDALLERLQNSGCEFNRNGSWANAAQAKTHLLRKLESVEATTTLRSTEQFIELVATSSGVSGKPYEVKCSGYPTIDSNPWLTRELSFIRLIRAK